MGHHWVSTEGPSAGALPGDAASLGYMIIPSSSSSCSQDSKSIRGMARQRMAGVLALSMPVAMVEAAVQVEAEDAQTSRRRHLKRAYAFACDHRTRSCGTSFYTKP